MQAHHRTLVWLAIVVAVVAGCSNINSHDAGLCEGETCADTEAHVVPAIQPAAPSRASYSGPVVSTGIMTVKVAANGVHNISHEFELYDGKVLYGGELISINDYLWKILPEEQR